MKDEPIVVPWNKRLSLDKSIPLIKVVGISAAGKSTLVKGLRQAGYNAHPVSQEHSHVPDLWAQFEKSQMLIYLDTTLEDQRRRRPDVSWSEKTLEQEAERLTHARDHADLVINTAGTAANDVLDIALTFLAHNKFKHADGPLPEIAATGSFRRK